MPHDGFNDISGTAVVQSVAVSATDERETTPPQWSGATPSGTDVVDHEEAVLNHVGVGSYLLVWIAWQAVVTIGEEAVGVGEVIRICGPAGTVAGGATHVAKQLSATLYG